jgi:precorrin-3B methylase
MDRFFDGSVLSEINRMRCRTDSMKSLRDVKTISSGGRDIFRIFSLIHHEMGQARLELAVVAPITKSFMQWLQGVFMSHGI